MLNLTYLKRKIMLKITSFFLNIGKIMLKLTYIYHVLHIYLNLQINLLTYKNQSK